MKQYKVRIEGLSPLLHHGSHAVGMDKATNKQKGGNALEGDSDEWKKTIYYDELTGVFVPGINMEATLIEAAKEFKITGRKTATKYFKSGVFINDDKMPITVKGKPITDLDKVEVDKRTVKNPSTKMRNMRYRAIFRQWEIVFVVTVAADDYIKQDLLKNVIEYAGMYVGLCDFRPRFGRFRITDIELI